MPSTSDHAPITHNLQAGSHARCTGGHAVAKKQLLHGAKKRLRRAAPNVAARRADVGVED